MLCDLLGSDGRVPAQLHVEAGELRGGAHVRGILRPPVHQPAPRQDRQLGGHHRQVHHCLFRISSAKPLKHWGSRDARYAYSRDAMKLSLCNWVGRRGGVGKGSVGQIFQTGLTDLCLFITLLVNCQVTC